jgi:hypothetical protein
MFGALLSAPTLQERLTLVFVIQDAIDICRASQAIVRRDAEQLDADMIRPHRDVARTHVYSSGLTEQQLSRAHADLERHRRRPRTPATLSDMEFVADGVRR